MHTELSIYFGEQVQTLRKANKLTQEELATSCGVSVKILSEYENGKGNPSLTTIAALKKAFRVSADVFFKPDIDAEDAHIKELVANYLTCSDEQQKTFFDFVQFTAQKTLKQKLSCWEEPREDA